MIERFHAHLLELLELIERWLGIDHVPVVGETGIVDLQHDAGLNDRFVLFVHSVSRGEQEFFLGLVVEIHTAGEFLFASADAMHEEYKAIVEAGIVLQIDDPSLPDNWDMINPEPPLNEFKKFEQVRMEALNHALRGLPADRIRFHICWGSWHGPHTTDIPLKDIVDLVLSVNAGAYSVE